MDLIVGPHATAGVTDLFKADRDEAQLILPKAPREPLPLTQAGLGFGEHLTGSRWSAQRERRGQGAGQAAQLALYSAKLAGVDASLNFRDPVTIHGGLISNVAQIASAFAHRPSLGSIASAALEQHGGLFGASPIGLTLATATLTLVAVGAERFLQRDPGKRHISHTVALTLSIAGNIARGGVTYATSRIHVCALAIRQYGIKAPVHLFDRTYRDERSGEISRQKLLGHVTRNMMIGIGTVFGAVNLKAYMIPVSLVIRAVCTQALRGVNLKEKLGQLKLTFEAARPNRGPDRTQGGELLAALQARKIQAVQPTSSAPLRP